VAYICLFVNAALDGSAVPAAIVALGVTVLGLSAVNGSDALETVLDGRSPIAYWMQTGLIALYFILLIVLYAVGRRSSQTIAQEGRTTQCCGLAVKSDGVVRR
jgi:protein-S-isoprenylcysteine O-methyltransferase Ste14